MIKKIFNGQNSIIGATAILISTLTLSNILGVIRDHFLAQKIPTTILDTYYVAFRIPDLIFNLLILGAIASAFIPVFTQYRASGRNIKIGDKELKEHWYIFNSFFNLAFLSLIVLTVIFFFLMPYLIPILAPKFSPDKQLETVNLARIMLLSPIFFGISYIIGGALNAYQRFFIYSLAPLVYNLSIILSIIFLADRFSVTGVALGVVVGAFLHLVIQIPTLFALGYRPKAIFDFKHSGVKKIFYLMIPRSIGLASTQIMLLIFTAVASTLGGGAIAIFNLADNIQTVPTVIFGTSLATALFPTLAAYCAKDNKEDFRRYTEKGIRAILYLMIPASVGIILLRAQIVRLILGSGHFGWEQTTMAYETLGFFAISLFAQGLIPLLAKSFYAMQNTKTPMFISIISVTVSILSALYLGPKLGIKGLALAFSIGSIVDFFLLWFALKKQIIFNFSAIFFATSKIVLASFIMALAMQYGKNIIAAHVDMERFWGIFVQTSVAAAVGLAVYVLMAILLKSREMIYILNIVKNKLKPGSYPIEDILEE